MPRSTGVMRERRWLSSRRMIDWSASAVEDSASPPCIRAGSRSGRGPLPCSSALVAGARTRRTGRCRPAAPTLANTSLGPGPVCRPPDLPGHSWGGRTRGTHLRHAADPHVRNSSFVNTKLSREPLSSPHGFLRTTHCARLTREVKRFLHAATAASGSAIEFCAHTEYFRVKSDISRSEKCSGAALTSDGAVLTLFSARSPHHPRFMK